MKAVGPLLLPFVSGRLTKLVIQRKHSDRPAHLYLFLTQSGPWIMSRFRFFSLTILIYSCMWGKLKTFSPVSTTAALELELASH